MVINNIGDCLMCTHDPAKGTKIGNCYESTLQELWNGKNMFEFRKMLLEMGKSIDAVILATGNPLSSGRNCACEALGKIGVATPPVRDALVRCLSDKYYRARYHAAWSLGELKAVEAVPYLEAALREEEVRDVRQEMERVIGLLRARNP